MIWNNALCTANSSITLSELRKRPDLWGRLVENAVGAHLLNHFPSGNHVYYWREGTDEVDYVLQQGKTVVAFEVKTGRPRSLRGLQLFQKAHPHAKTLVIGSGGIPLEDFFRTSPTVWLP